MDVKKLERLAELRIAERQIKTEIEEILPIVTASADELDSGTELEVSNGKFVVSKRRVWTYPDSVQSKKVEYDEAKKESEQDGSAEYTEKASLIFKADGGDVNEQIDRLNIQCIVYTWYIQWKHGNKRDAETLWQSLYWLPFCVSHSRTTP